MTQVSRNKFVAREVGQRLGIVLDDLIGRSAAEVARELGYKNATVLSRARRGETSLSAEKLQALARLDLAGGGQVSLHWLLTGEGLQTVMPERAHRSRVRDSLAKRVSEAPPSVRAKIEAFLDVLDPSQSSSEP